MADKQISKSLVDLNRGLRENQKASNQALLVAQEVDNQKEVAIEEEHIYTKGVQGRMLTQNRSSVDLYTPISKQVFIQPESVVHQEVANQVSGAGSIERVGNFRPIRKSLLFKKEASPKEYDTQKGTLKLVASNSLNSASVLSTPKAYQQVEYKSGLPKGTRLQYTMRSVPKDYIPPTKKPLVTNLQRVLYKKAISGFNQTEDVEKLEQNIEEPVWARETPL